MSVVYKISHNRPAEIHVNLDVSIRAASRLKGNIDRIQVLPLIWRHAHSVSSQDQEMHLMDVERVVFLCPILNDPVLLRPLSRDVGRGIVRVQNSGCSSVNRDEEIRGATDRVKRRVRQARGSKLQSVGVFRVQKYRQKFTGRRTGCRFQ
jgi:hypothetical protein